MSREHFLSRVQGGLTPSTSSADNSDADSGTVPSTDPSAAPVHDGGAMVTLAVNARDAETIVFAAEHGTIWLSIVHPDASEDGTRIVDPGNAYR